MAVEKTREVKGTNQTLIKEPYNTIENHVSANIQEFRSFYQ